MTRARKQTLVKIISYILLIILTAATLMPLLWMLSASLKTNTEVFSANFRWIPAVFQWNNYVKIWSKIPLATFTFNTVKLTVIITFIQVITSSFAAYGFSKCKFKGRDVLFLCYVATIAIPWQVYMLPQYSMMNKFHLVDTHTGYVLMQSFTAFGVFLMRQFFMSLPNELLEAARIDGATTWQQFTKITLPVLKPITYLVVTLGIIWSFQVFDLAYLMTGGGPGHSSVTLVMGIYNAAFKQYKMGYACAMAMFLLLMIIIINVVEDLFFKEKKEAK